MDEFPLDIGWYSYLTRFLPGWPWLEPDGDRRIWAYIFSLLLVFLLTFVAEFFTKSPIVAPGRSRASAAAAAAAQRGMAMFMFYLAIVVVVATDYLFFLAAVGGHLAGHFVAGIYEYDDDVGARDYYMDHRHYSYYTE
ncbi:hypothetical protein M569_04211 [Genlisea aurea]|uniref:Copper transporter n=1 Tax=Genlisea aurea TaxID=192259 RepID=S8CUT3_9LAMI|nr:hypothetical protein M569_04211 [Genlisea aurea]